MSSFNNSMKISFHSYIFFFILLGYKGYKFPEEIIKISKTSYHGSKMYDNFKREFIIDEKGIQITWIWNEFKREQNGFGDYGIIPYDTITKIYIKKLKKLSSLFFSNNKYYRVLTLETNDNKITYINLDYHPGRIIIPLLRKYLKKNWRKVFIGIEKTK